MAKRRNSSRSHKRMSKTMMSGKMMGGVGAADYGGAVYGAAGQQHAGQGNMIAMNQVGGAENSPEIQKLEDELNSKYGPNAMLTQEEKIKKQELVDKIALLKAGQSKGGRKSNMNFMMVPKMFMRMTRSRKHRRASKRHHGKSRKHRK